MTIEEYCTDHSSLPANTDSLAWIEHQTHIRTSRARMLSGRTEGGFLSAISRMVAPRRILELGVFTGYSTVCLAEGLADGGTIDAIEINDELEDIIRGGYEKAGISDKVNLLLGDAVEIIPTLPGPYDLVYIDANKRQYPEYWNLVSDKVRPGGVIIADNTTWDGKVIEEPAPRDAQSVGILEFNDMVAADNRFSSIILPLRDGVTIAMRK
jgi:predicted O-methyltransferase YrrM